MHLKKASSNLRQYTHSFINFSNANRYIQKHTIQFSLQNVKKQLGVIKILYVLSRNAAWVNLIL